MELESNNLNYANLNNFELEKAIDNLRLNINNLWKEKHRIKHRKNLEVDLKYRARMERHLCIQLLKMVKSSKHKQTRKYEI